ncbi:phosphosulfolactate synthase [Ferviditalea candida]|uniref:Phosphosulfolactate synthase n=1 Tax=Ferviditalea candida TaxID=3108399 RepID=A0ABU5ZG31_9BACL|nr:phosphosulfolactate synthase [Paenibacillaceae bacterium T2]
MKVTVHMNWHPQLADPTGSRNMKPRSTGKTMVIDKGLGLHTFEDLLHTSGEYIDIIKLGFGTSPLYPKPILERKIQLARENDICILPGGTFLESAICHDVTDAFFGMIAELGFTGLEVSDGTIEMDRNLRNQLIMRGVKQGFRVFTEYGKKTKGSSIHSKELVDTVHIDTEYGAELVIIEGRESGKGVGIYDEQGDFEDGRILDLLKNIPNPSAIMWEAPLKDQQVHLIRLLGRDANLGNIAAGDLLSLESLRRGLRSDTFSFANDVSHASFDGI